MFVHRYITAHAKTHMEDTTTHRYPPHLPNTHTHKHTHNPHPRTHVYINTVHRVTLCSPENCRAKPCLLVKKSVVNCRLTVLKVLWASGGSAEPLSSLSSTPPSWGPSQIRSTSWTSSVWKTRKCRLRKAPNTFTVPLTFRAFSRRFYPKRLTISTFVRRKTNQTTLPSVQ